MKARVNRREMYAYVSRLGLLKYVDYKAFSLE